MNKILKYILFRTVLIIVILHTFVPHPHSDELTKDEHIVLHKKSNSIIGIIRLIFHENNDENLDNLIFAKYEYSKRLIIKDKFQNSLFYDVLCCVIKEFKIEHFITNKVDNFKRSLFIKLNGSRAPPLLF